MQTSDRRPLNLEVSLFHWPSPQDILIEDCTEANGLYADESLRLWRVDALVGSPPC